MKRISIFLNKCLIIGLVAMVSASMFSCSKSDEASSISVNSSALTLSSSGQTSEVIVTSNVNWTATCSGSGFSVKPSNGTSGTTTVTITADPNATTLSRTGTITFSSIKGDATSSVSLSQDPLSISVESTECQVVAGAGTGTVNVKCNGEWVLSLPTLPSWITSIEPTSGNGNATVTVTTTANSMNSELDYELHVCLKSSSAVNSVVTVKKAASGNANSYSDGGYRLYMQSSKSKPVVLVFTGDGYTADMFTYNTGKFDIDLNKAIEGLFAIEPYKSLKSYFTVYKVAACSNEAGISNTSTSTVKNTAFSCVMKGGNSTGISCNFDNVWKYEAKIPELSTDAAQTYSPVCVIINASEYAGTCYFSSKSSFGGMYVKTIGMVPLGIAGNSKTTLENIVQHEYGGHGYGLLGDEYSYTSNGTIPADEVEALTSWQQNMGSFLNVTTETDIKKAPWAQFDGKDEYAAANIGLYVGAYTYIAGVYKSENTSCMIDNRSHYNTQSRWLIYKRIKETAGETPSLADFISLDVDKTDKTSGTKTPAGFRPLGRPILIMDGKVQK